MPRTLLQALVALTLLGGGVSGQALDDTLVPRGQLRLQAHPVFSSWDRRFGRAEDGSEGRESLGVDLTDPTGLALFPGSSDLIGHVEDITGTPGYLPSIGSTEGRAAHDVTRIEFGGHLGVFDWLTVGMIVPWTQTRTAIDINLAADSSSLGLSPTVTNGTAVDAYLGGLGSASAAAQAAAASACSGGPSASCTAAQTLADRASSLLGSAQGAYDASLVFPIVGSSVAGSLASVSSTLDADLMAAGLPGIGAPMVFADQTVTEETLRTLPSLVGASLLGSTLGSRRGLWQTGDLEVTALARVFDRRPDDPGGLALRMSVGALVRLPTGTPEDPDIFIDIGTGDGQSDIEGRVVGSMSWGPLALALAGRYGVQQPVTLTKRVAPLEVPVPLLPTRTDVRWSPGDYLWLEAAPSLRLTDQLTLTGALRYFEKGRDEYELVDPSSGLDPVVLARESGQKLLQVGGGLRYATVEAWQDGIASRPLELHLRLVHSIAGGGGHTPVETRLEVGLRLFKRIWGPEPTP